MIRIGVIGEDVFIIPGSRVFEEFQALELSLALRVLQLPPLCFRPIVIRQR